VAKKRSKGKKLSVLDELTKDIPELKVRTLRFKKPKPTTDSSGAGKGKAVDNCPLELKVCYPSCYWWRGGECCYWELIAKHDKT